MDFDQSLHQRQPNAQAALGAVQRPLCLREEIEDAREEVGSDADARIPHTHHGFIAFLLDAQPDATAFVGVLGGVVEQVHHHLFDAGRVGVQPDRFRRLRHVSSCLRCSIRGRTDSTARSTTLLTSTVLLVKPDPAGGDAGDFQQVIDQMRQLSHLTLNDGPRLLLDRVLASLLQTKEMHGIHDGSQRVAEFVRQHRQELVLAAVEVRHRFRLHLRPFQLAVCR